MGRFLQNMVASFAGRMLAALFIAVFVFLGFGPNRWAEFLIGTASPIWIWLLRIALLILAASVFWRIFLATALSNSTLILTWQYRPEYRDWAPARRMITLAMAAQLAYEKLRGRSVSAQKLPVKFADMKFEGEAAPISWFGTAILGRGEIPVFGRHPPSTKLEIVPKIIIEKSGALSDDASSLKLFGEKAPEYEGLIIRRVDFLHRLTVIEGWHGENT